MLRCEEHVGIIANWNRSLQAIGPDSKYIKFVHADDWLFADCLARMAELAEEGHEGCAFRVGLNTQTQDRARPMGWRFGCRKRGVRVEDVLGGHKAQCSKVGSPSRGLARHGFGSCFCLKVR